MLMNKALTVVNWIVGSWPSSPNDFGDSDIAVGDTNVAVGDAVDTVEDAIVTVRAVWSG